MRVLPLFCHHSAVCLPRFFCRYAREEASGEEERSAKTTANCLNACWTPLHAGGTRATAAYTMVHHDWLTLCNEC